MLSDLRVLLGRSLYERAVSALIVQRMPRGTTGSARYGWRMKNVASARVAPKSTVPAIAGQTTQIYVREVAKARHGREVVLFVHGAGTPSEVAFDVPYQDYSWMAYLAKAGYDVFAMDMTGYGRSTRPLQMNDPCNLAAEQQKSVFGSVCAATYTQQMTTVPSDWNDIGAVVDYLRALRGVEKVSLIGWSLGGPRAGGYAAKNPGKVAKMVLLAPAYRRGTGAAPAATAAYATQSREEFDLNWNRQIGCKEQVDMKAREAVWADMLASDPQASTWGPGVRRAPLVSWLPDPEVVAGEARHPAVAGRMLEEDARKLPADEEIA